MRPSRTRTTTAAAHVAQATVLALLAALCFLGVGAGPAAAADGDVPWTVRTASNDFGSGRQNYTYAVNPGGHLQDGLVVVNNGTTPLDLAVYAADGFTTKAGQLDLVTKDAKSTRVGAWVHTSRPELTVEPGQSVEVPFSVEVPDDAAPGDYLGGVVTSLTQAGDAGTSVDRRLGIRIRLRVGGQLRPNLSVQDVHLRYADTLNPFGKGDATVTYTIRNTGNAILAARQTASIAAPFGAMRAAAGHIDDSPQLLPGETWKVTARVHEVAPALRTTATVTVVPLLTDAASSTAPLAAVSAQARTIPWALLVLAVVVCALVVAGGLAVRRRRRVTARADAGRGEEPVEQTSRERETSDQ
ncbi:WxL protein peptidoglycan domain-containing protein [Actinopolymorpha pittospori]